MKMSRWMTSGGLLLALLALATPAARAATHETRAVALPDSVLVRVGHSTRAQDVIVRDVREALAARTPAGGAPSAADAADLLAGLTDRAALRIAIADSPVAWAAEDSAGYTQLGEELELKTGLADLFADGRERRHAQGLAPLDDAHLGALLCDSTLARLDSRWNDELFDTLAAAFAAIPAPLPTDDIVGTARKLSRNPYVSPADSDGVLVDLRSGRYTVRDLLDLWRSLRSLDRPHLDDAGQLKRFVGAAIFRREARARAHRERVLDRPGNRALLERRAEYFAVRGWTTAHVYAAIPRDSVTVRREFDRNPSAYAAPPNCDILPFELATRAAADSVAAELRRPFGFDSLAARCKRTGSHDAEPVSTALDSALTARCLAAGAGTVIGPERVAGKWHVTAVLRAQKARLRPFEEARRLVAQSWFNRESERRLRETLDSLLARYGVTRNEGAWAGLVRELGAAAPPVADPAHH